MSETFIHPRGWLMGRGTQTLIAPSSGNYGVTVIVPDLKLIAWVLEWSFHSVPIVSHGTVENEKISGNVVGCTLLGVGGGTTLTVEVKAVGL